MRKNIAVWNVLSKCDQDRFRTSGTFLEFISSFSLFLTFLFHQFRNGELSYKRLITTIKLLPYAKGSVYAKTSLARFSVLALLFCMPLRLGIGKLLIYCRHDNFTAQLYFGHRTMSCDMSNIIE